MFNDGFNVLLGKNGTGKTTLLRLANTPDDTTRAAWSLVGERLVSAAMSLEMTMKNGGRFDEALGRSPPSQQLALTMMPATFSWPF